jgi:hypothetical protein
MRDRLDGENPNSAAMRIMSSACLFATATYGDCIGNPEGDFTIAPYFRTAATTSAQSA